ncbi:hypothetical protein TNCV_3690791 [Trichonephila clavipes]|nr:hypothetical protein TNCV_3690791 [Trichonephila clavipes]
MRSRCRTTLPINACKKNLLKASVEVRIGETAHYTRKVFRLSESPHRWTERRQTVARRPNPSNKRRRRSQVPQRESHRISQVIDYQRPLQSIVSSAPLVSLWKKRKENELCGLLNAHLQELG